ncbi:MAG: T9SS type A sorting domain-containing protein [Bacteroidetes bacterium]|nr:T9SS type A sorting domain-containing protein [Bacteroidota bacterium]
MACSNAITVTGFDEIAKVDINIFPNPVNDKLIISSKEDIDARIRICNLNGMEVMHDDLFGKEKVLLTEGLKSGFYILSLDTEKGIIFQKKIILIQGNRPEQEDSK